MAALDRFYYIPMDIKFRGALFVFVHRLKISKAVLVGDVAVGKTCLVNR